MTTLAGLLGAGRLRRGGSVLRDYVMLPVLEARLELARRRAKPDRYALPTLLSRDQAGTPSTQEVESLR